MKSLPLDMVCSFSVLLYDYQEKRGSLSHTPRLPIQVNFQSICHKYLLKVWTIGTQDPLPWHKTVSLKTAKNLPFSL